MNTTRRGLLAASGAALAMPALAAWPERTVSLVVPYTAGGSTDVVARLLAPRLQAILGQSFVVDNRTGAGGSIGTATVARGPADGTVFLVSSASNHVMYPIVAPGSMPDPRGAFAGVSQLADIPLALTVANRLGVSDMAGLLALLKREPGRHSFASSGVGGSQHLAGELFAMRAGVDIVHVPYRGGGPALNDLVAGQVSLAFLNLPTALPQAEAGKVKILAVAGEKRSALKPDIPTVTELGVQGFAVRSWTALFAPRATPPEIVTRLSGAVRQALEEPGMKARFAELGAEAEVSTPAELDSFVRDEFVLWEPVIRAAKVTAQ
ncbi:Bug family tripartite tricarboxylate transporter substrate binding protein [Muricoccus aerilatus]|uniref:Bug family tripartite tricarboxylate transporter substrate binding protein n=1 Tax=Muricoccus aerilatus TaxID=452982 RepID=UPI0005C26446|nr:tripartite tricarboxylate transporter substrate binding protein [Roseomonas aerilata]